MPEIRATARYARAIEAVHDLLTKLRMDFLFLGSVARSAWLESEVASGSIDTLATMGPQQKNQVAMMASNRGFRVEREEVEASEELDMIPMHFDDLRVHVLVASNALYGRMVASGAEVAFGDGTLRVPLREDFALLLAMTGDEVALHALTSTPEFNRHAYNEKVRSIGLGEHALA
jgi:hypothetical protein